MGQATWLATTSIPQSVRSVGGLAALWVKEEESIGQKRCFHWFCWNVHRDSEDVGGWQRLIGVLPVLPSSEIRLLLGLYTFYLLAALCADEASDGAEVVEVCAVQHSEQWLLRPAPLDRTARLLLPVINRWTQLGGSLASRILFCYKNRKTIWFHCPTTLGKESVWYWFNLHTCSCTHFLLCFGIRLLTVIYLPTDTRVMII